MQTDIEETSRLTVTVVVRNAIFFLLESYLVHSVVKTKVVDINDNPPVMALEEINGGVSVDAGDDFEIQVEATDADTPVREKEK